MGGAATVDLVALMLLPQRLMLGWLETHVRLVETSASLVDRHIVELEQTLERWLELQRMLACETDLGQRAKLRAQYLGLRLDDRIEGARHRFLLATGQQLDALELIARRATEAMAALDRD